MTTYTPYPAYRPSGVDWLSDLPDHWDQRRLKFVAPPATAKLSEKPPNKTYLGLENVESGTGRLLLDSPTENVESAVTVFQLDDVLFGKLRPYLAKVVHADFEGVCTGELMVLRPVNHLVHSRFLFYLMLSHGFINIVDSMTYGAKMPRANPNHVVNLPISLPSLAEQRAIAAFLDRETVWLDRLIAKKRKLVELLHKQRIAVISHAVTKGLNPHAPLKPSGIEWLGNVPAHWEVSKLKYVVHLKSGEGITSENIFAEGEYAVYGGNGLRGYSDKYTHHGNFVLIGRQGALCGNINYGNGKFFASEHAVVATPVRPVATLWLGELLKVMNLNQYSLSAAQPGLAVDRIKQLSVPLPPIGEQTTIADHLERQIFHFDDLTKKIETSIALLQKQRTAIISAAVTGKIDVRPQEPA